jgi:Na+-translocating ferredoxin:NAD+ oxidoreductase subunit E
MKKSGFNIVFNGIITENPIFVLILGMCPALATTTSAINGMSMGLATLFVLFGSNVAVSMLKNVIPDKVRIPAYVVVIATFVSVAEMLIHAYFPAIYDSLGIFIPLIVVNCIVLGRAEAFAAKNTVFSSALDGIGMGLGFTFALTLLGAVRELLGTGKAFNQVVFPEHYGALIFVLAPGAFIALGYLIAIMNKLVKSIK